VQNGTFKAVLTTKGRKTGKVHSVQLRAVSYNELIFFSRRNKDSDWLKNSLVEPIVQVEIDGISYSGIASLVTDEVLARKISELKYPGEERAQETRIVLQVKLTN
jgi:hypothetical protein